MKFELNEKQVTKLNEWKEAIKVVFGEYGNYKFTFTPTGIGDGVEVYSDLAKKSISLTDYDSW